ncbi:DUF1993 domain-containing protein [Phenylobacterium montanum]|uniref:DUF1993 domain-containing protein n=1 Tax=Phenylobacterium montanum TaxID=2823693 RepID=A0A975FUX3_9CAUL|nr:DUF1993 domain-containing protein [Caulobacter sp. S6]QUD85948.1 DUF1993 domain-containing protein [Caulobacter sp. S6]
MSAVNLFSFVDLFARSVVATKHLLAKGAAHVSGLGVPEREMLNWRLAEDMHPLGFQVMVVANFSRTWTARVAGLEPPEGIAADLDVAGLNAGLDAALDYLRALKPEQFDGRDEIPLTFEIMPGMAPTFPAARWLTVFAATNINFHVSMTYAILRNNGVPIGKADLFAAGLG